MTTEQALHDYASHRDAEAFRTLVRQYQGLVYSAASRQLARREDIEDVTQQTFLKLAQAAGSIRSNLAAWLHATTVHAAVDLVRKDATRRRRESAAAARGPSLEVWQVLSVAMDEEIARLPDPQRALIVDHFLEGQSQRALADRLGVSQATMSRRLQEAVAMLRKQMAMRDERTSDEALTASLAAMAAIHVPAEVSAGLTKIGLAGAPVNAGGGGGFVLVGTLMLAAVVSVGVMTWHGWQTPIAAGVSAPGKARAQAALEKTYALRDGEDLRWIQPPFAPERQAYIDAEFPYTRPATVNSLGFGMVKGKLRELYMSYSAPTLPQLIDEELRIHWYHVRILTASTGRLASVTG